MVNTSRAVQNISMNRPRAVDTSGLSLIVVRTSRSPGNRPDTRAAAAIAPTIWAIMEMIILRKPIAPISARPRLTYWKYCQCLPAAAAGNKHTAGLNKPPLMRKNTQTLTARLKPNDRLMYSNTDALALNGPVVGFAAAIKFATCVPAKAKNKNRNVPTNSPRKATSSLRIFCGRKCAAGNGFGIGTTDFLRSENGSATAGWSAGSILFMLTAQVVVTTTIDQ